MAGIYWEYILRVLLLFGGSEIHWSVRWFGASEGGRFTSLISNLKVGKPNLLELKKN